MACGNRGSKFVYLKALGGACGAYGAGERGVQGSGVETWGKETTGETQTQMGG